MFARRIKTGQPTADIADTALLQPANVQVAKSVDTKADLLAARKPSERFVRKPIEAKSRASHSERRRLADLAERLKRTEGNKAVLNEMRKLNDCRPQAERPTG